MSIPRQRRLGGESKGTEAFLRTHQYDMLAIFLLHAWPCLFVNEPEGIMAGSFALM